MGGIIDYYHGEGGRVVDKAWVCHETLTMRLELENDPHRRYAHDYGADIGIDPMIQIGDQVVYLRLDATCGVWVRTVITSDELPAAIERVQGNRMIMDQYATAQRDGAPAQDIRERLEQHARVLEELGNVESMHIEDVDRPATEATIFISYSSKSILMAREIYADLRADAKLDIWFDLAESADLPNESHRIFEWLRSAVFKSRAFVLLLTQSALDSTWVQSEVAWAAQRAAENPDFQLVVLRLADVPLPEVAREHAIVIDANGLWRVNGINEELFAALFGRGFRRAWLDDITADGVLLTALSDELFNYDDFASDAGRVLEFEYEAMGDAYRRYGQPRISWKLVYNDGAKASCVTGKGEREPIDLGIQPGDRVGFFLCRHRGGMQLEGRPLWMRADQVDLSPDEVLNRYYHTLGVAGISPQDVVERIFFVKGWDVYGRQMVDFNLRFKNGRYMSYIEHAWMTFTFVHSLDRRLSPRP